MQKYTAKKGAGAKNKNLGPCTKLTQKCMVKSSGWPHQNVSIYFIFVHFIWSSLVGWVPHFESRCFRDYINFQLILHNVRKISNYFLQLKRCICFVFGNTLVWWNQSSHGYPYLILTLKVLYIYIFPRGEWWPNIVYTYFHFHFHFQVEDNRLRGII